METGTRVTGVSMLLQRFYVPLVLPFRWTAFFANSTCLRGLNVL